MEIIFKNSDTSIKKKKLPTIWHFLFHTTVLPSGLWIHIHFLRIRIHQFFWMCIWIHLLKKCGSWSSLTKFVKKNAWRVFFIVVKHIKDCSKARNNGALGKFTLKNLINLQFLAISLNFFCFYLKNFPSWIRIRIQYADPVPGDKMNADPDPQPCLQYYNICPLSWAEQFLQHVC